MSEDSDYASEHECEIDAKLERAFAREPGDDGPPFKSTKDRCRHYEAEAPAAGEE